MNPPSFLSEALGAFLFALADMQPLALVYLHLIVSALFPIYAASHASLSCPTSAKKAERSKEKKDEDDEDEDEDDLKVHVMEGLRPSDAVLFPILAGITLTVLYLLIKWGSTWLNVVLNVYFGILAVPAITQLLSDTFASLIQLIFPRKYVDGNRLFLVLQEIRQARPVAKDGHRGLSRPSPLPAFLSNFPLGSHLTNLLWKVRGFLTTRFILRIKAARLFSFKLRFGVPEIGSALTTGVLLLYYNLFGKLWWITNIMGFAYSYSALRLMSPSTFGTGTLMLAGLFVYDIYMVFFTPMMITVAKSIEAPIKLVFPRPPPPSATPGKAYFSMLGLGDIVLPGIMIGLALRFDLYMHYLRKQSKTSVSAIQARSKGTVDSKASEVELPEVSLKPDTMRKARYRAPTNHPERFWLTSWAQIIAPRFTGPSRYVETFPKPYFHASLVGYTLGLIATLFSMHIMQHGQPALLYLVPGVLIACWGSAVVRGELSVFYNFCEHDDPEAQSTDGKTDTKKSEEREEDKKTKSIEPSTAEAKPSALKAPESDSKDDEKPDTSPTDTASTEALSLQRDGAAKESPKATKTVRFDLPDARPRSPGNFEAHNESVGESASGGDVLFSLTVTRLRRATKTGEEDVDVGLQPAVSAMTKPEVEADAPAYVEAAGRKRVRLA